MLRRTVLLSGLSLAATSAFAFRSVAQTSVGQARLTSVSDGHLVLPESFVIGDLPADEARAIVEAAGFSADGYEPPCNLTLWESGDAKVLFDAGSGSGFMPTAGQIVDSLAAIELTPDDITHVIFTHGHPDHLWGALDDFDEPLFANASHHMGAEEQAYWTDPATLDSIEPERQSFVAGAARRLEVLGSGLVLFGDGDEVMPGIKAVATPGHTPGHMSFRLSDGSETVFVIGDAIGNGHLALARPDWASPADQIPDQGIETRMALLQELAASGERAVGFHLPGGGIGTFGADDGGFTFTQS
ncbi:MBL fold metallo-hydrolase [Paracoccus sp. TK19116]|uniref:MBL fold metallo-hydrolase n=1 Tax=Paracoccus albicereus TaxID=2922394 RepID=A0ABT1MUY2_9RHOB|nr:MBL fold metallo-hydrolase [Paracoccus albicereus]MCQ0972148.1 MBL fold metallo-hydrolase [Paracoccus albicereus]